MAGEHDAAAASLARTDRWAARARQLGAATGPGGLFGIVQGGSFRELREARRAGSPDIGFDGYAIGGVSVGEPPPSAAPPSSGRRRCCRPTGRAT